MLPVRMYALVIDRTRVDDTEETAGNEENDESDETAPVDDSIDAKTDASDEINHSS